MKTLAIAGAALLTANLACAAASAPKCCEVVELRQYITYPGKRDALITLFEHEFIESQEAVGIRVLGQFRDKNDPNRFTWVRGFQSMPERKQALGDFYFGPLWKRLSKQANETLYDNDDVLLLRPAAAGAGFAMGAVERPPLSATTPQAGFVVVNLYYFKQPVSAEFVERFGRELAPVFERHGAQILGRFVTEPSANTFERLPVRENVNVFVWFAHFADRAAFDHYNDRLASDARWRDELFAPLYKSLARAPETLMLEPAARSLIR